MNLGTILFMTLYLFGKIIVCFIGWILTKTCKRKSNKVYFFYNNLHKGLFWNGIIIFIVGAFIEFTMAAYIAVWEPIPETTFPNDKVEVMSGEVISYWSAVFTIPIILITVAASGWIIFKDPE